MDHQHIVVCPGNGKFYCLECGYPLTPREAYRALDEQTTSALEQAKESIACDPAQSRFPEIDWSQFEEAS